MAERPTRCPHCWAALPPTVGVLCPHCVRPVERAKAKRRLGSRARSSASKAPFAPPVAASGPEAPPARFVTPVYTPPVYTPPLYTPPVSRAPVTTPPVSEPSPPYDPPPALEAPLADDPVAPDEALPAADAPASFSPPTYTLGGYRLGVPGSAPTPAAPAPAAAAPVGLLEREPVEFGGTPLPPGFFDALQAEPRTGPVISRRMLRFGALAVVGLVSLGLAARDRTDAVTSPARHLVAGACSEYRDFSTDLGPDWYVVNADRFIAGAQLDPKLAGAAEFMTWIRARIDAGPESIASITDAEFELRSEPLVEACWNGPGRA